MTSLNELYPNFFRLCVESAVFFNVNVPPNIRGYIYGTHVTEEFLELLAELEGVDDENYSRPHNLCEILEECRDVLFYLCCLQGSTGISFERVEGVPNPAKLLGSLKRSFLRETPSWEPLQLNVGIVLNKVVSTLRNWEADNDIELYQYLQEKLWIRYPQLCEQHKIPRGTYFDLTTPSKMLQRWEEDRNFYSQNKEKKL